MNYFDWNESFEVQASRELNGTERSFLESAIRYLAESKVRGEKPAFTWESNWTLIVYFDSTKSPRSDITKAFTEFSEGIDEIMTEGSPVRKTNHSGPGTQGTRLVNVPESFSDVGLAFVSDTTDVTHFRPDQFRLKTLTVPQPEIEDETDDEGPWIVTITRRFLSGKVETDELNYETEDKAMETVDEIEQAMLDAKNVVGRTDVGGALFLNLTHHDLITVEVTLDPA